MTTIIVFLLLFSVVMAFEIFLLRIKNKISYKLINQLSIENLNYLQAGSAALKVLHRLLKSGFTKDGYAKVWMHDKLWTFSINENDIIDIKVSESDDGFFNSENDFLN